MRHASYAVTNSIRHAERIWKILVGCRFRNWYHGWHKLTPEKSPFCVTLQNMQLVRWCVPSASEKMSTQNAKHDPTTSSAFKRIEVSIPSKQARQHLNTAFGSHITICSNVVAEINLNILVLHEVYAITTLSRFRCGKMDLWERKWSHLINL